MTHVTAYAAASMPWRVGRKVGRTIYAQSGPTASDDDRLIGTMDTPELAAEAVRTHNDALRPVSEERQPRDSFEAWKRDMTSPVRDDLTVDDLIDAAQGAQTVRVAGPQGGTIAYETTPDEVRAAADAMEPEPSLREILQRIEARVRELEARAVLQQKATSALGAQFVEEVRHREDAQLAMGGRFDGIVTRILDVEGSLMGRMTNINTGVTQRLDAMGAALRELRTTAHVHESQAPPNSITLGVEGVVKLDVDELEKP